MRVIRYRQQRTLAAPVEVGGVGFITGARVLARFRPAPAGTGITFHRTDVAGAVIPARVPEITGTQRRTTLGPAATGITLVEHLLAALAGLRIDNCRVEIDGPEPPGLDGSAAGFVAALGAAGAVHQPTRRPVYAVDEPVTVSAGGATLSLHPCDSSRHTPCAVAGHGTRSVPATLRVSYLLDYGLRSPIGRQSYTVDATTENFVREVASCRTFLTEPEAHALRAQGVGAHLTPAEVLVFGPRGPIGNRLRFADEPARHKVLDLIGDLALCGFDLAGHVVAYRSGHALNAALARRLTELAAAGTPMRTTARQAA